MSNEVRLFTDGVMERIVLWKRYEVNAIAEFIPKEPIFVRTEPPPQSALSRYSR